MRKATALSKKGVLALLNREYDELQDQIDPLLAIEDPTHEQMARISELDHQMDILIEKIVELEDGQEDVGNWYIIPTKRFNL